MHMSWGVCLPSRLLMTCLDLCVKFAEINQCPLDVITRIHVHERQEDTQTSRYKERQQERQTDKQKHWYMSHPFSLFPFHAKAGLTRLKQVSVVAECMPRCVCPVQKMILSLRVFF